MPVIILIVVLRQDRSRASGTGPGGPAALGSTRPSALSGTHFSIHSAAEFTNVWAAGADIRTPLRTFASLCGRPHQEVRTSAEGTRDLGLRTYAPFCGSVLVTSLARPSALHPLAMRTCALLLSTLRTFALHPSALQSCALHPFALLTPVLVPFRTTDLRPSAPQHCDHSHSEVTFALRPS